jgi:hypothetical protein
LSIVHWILSESHFSHMVCFCASFPQFLIKHNGHLLFHFPHHSNIKRTHALPFLIWDCIRLREATVGGWVLQQAGQECQNMLVPIHTGELIPIQILFACTLHVFTVRFPDQNSVWICYLALCATYLINLVTVPGHK